MSHTYGANGQVLPASLTQTLLAWKSPISSQMTILAFWEATYSQLQTAIDGS